MNDDTSVPERSGPDSSCWLAGVSVVAAVAFAVYAVIANGLLKASIALASAATMALYARIVWPSKHPSRGFIVISLWFALVAGASTGLATVALIAISVTHGSLSVGNVFDVPWPIVVVMWLVVVDLWEWRTDRS